MVPAVPTPVRIGLPLAYNGAIISAHAAVDDPILGGGLTVDFDINGTPLAGGSVIIPAVPPPGFVAPGLPITGANLFTPTDVLNILVTLAAPVVAGDVDVFLVFQRTLNAGEYLLNHVNDNRVIVTHPAAQSGYAVVLG